MSELVPFEFEKNQIRVVTDTTGEPLFVAKDVCGVLGYANDRAAVSRHCKGVAIHKPFVSRNATRSFRLVSEPDVLRLIIHSKLPAAQRFERWVFEEVLPQIRRTGSYTMPGAGRQGTGSGVRSLVFEKQMAIRVKGDPTGKPWFCGVDVARLLGFGTPQMAIYNHCLDVVRYEALPCGHRDQHHRMLSETDVMRLVVKATHRVEWAHRFGQWIRDLVVGGKWRELGEECAQTGARETEARGQKSEGRGPRLLESPMERALKLAPVAVRAAKAFCEDRRTALEDAAQVIQDQTGVDLLEVFTVQCANPRRRSI